MARPVKHVQLHRIGPTELHVVSDVDEGVLAIVQQEEAVIRGMLSSGPWPHARVSLFVLRDLQPLARQLRGGALPPGGAAALDTRTVVNMFDLASLEACHVFVNRAAMSRAGYWDDALAISGLLAHEHAHPLAECGATRASRALSVALSVDAGDPDGRLARILAGLIEELCVYAPRELFTNEVAISRGFTEAMLHLNRRNVANACLSIAGRERLREVLAQDRAAGSRTAQAVSWLLLAGDLESHLRLALEIVPFARAGATAAAAELNGVLEQTLFPQLEPEVATVYRALCELYGTLSAQIAAPALRAWATEVAAIVLAPLRERGLAVRCAFKLAT